MADFMIQINESLIETILASRGEDISVEQVVQEALALLYWATDSIAKNRQIVSVTREHKLVERVLLTHEKSGEQTAEERRARFKLIVSQPQ